MSEIAPRERASNALLKVIGAKRVAAWCGVDIATPYQWLSRGTEANPIPPKYVPIIIKAALAEGLPVAWDDLWPDVSSNLTAVP